MSTISLDCTVQSKHRGNDSGMKWRIELWITRINLLNVTTLFVARGYRFHGKRGYGHPSKSNLSIHPHNLVFWLFCSLFFLKSSSIQACSTTTRETNSKPVTLNENSYSCAPINHTQQGIKTGPATSLPVQLAVHNTSILLF